MGCHAILQGIFLTPGANPGLLHCKQILYHLSHLDLMIKGSKMSVHQDSIKIQNAYCGTVPKDGHHQLLLSLYVNTTPQVKRWRLGLFSLHLSPVTHFDQASLLASDSCRAALAMN